MLQIAPGTKICLACKPRSLQVASTLSAESEILRSETSAELAREVSDFGVSDTRFLSQRPAKSRTCRGLSVRLKM